MIGEDDGGASIRQRGGLDAVTNAGVARKDGI